MDIYYPRPCPYSVSVQGRTVVFENEFTHWEHDLDRGGELSGAVVKNGSGLNMVSAPQALIVSTIENGTFREFSTARCRIDKWELKEQSLVLTQYLADEKGCTLPGVTVEHTVEYSPWG